MSTDSGSLRILRLGLTPYEEALDLQEQLVRSRAEKPQPDTLIIVEHPPVITMGRNASGEHVLFTEEALAERGVTLVRCDRGGDATFHGPGQLVVYPILDLRARQRGVRKYVSDLEEVMIRCCKDFGILAGRKEGMAGAWLGGEGTEPWRKIGAVGVRVSKWITSHGLALNVTTNLSYYQLINPCGITEHPVTSLEKELGGKGPSLEDVTERLLLHFSRVLI